MKKCFGIIVIILLAGFVPLFATSCSSSSGGDGTLGGGGGGGGGGDDSFPAVFEDLFDGIELDPVHWQITKVAGGAEQPEVVAGELKLECFIATIDPGEVEISLLKYGYYNVVEADVTVTNVTTPNHEPSIRLSIEISDDAGAAYAAVDLSYSGGFLSIVPSINDASHLEIAGGLPNSLPANIGTTYTLRITVNPYDQEVDFFADGVRFFRYSTTGLTLPIDSGIKLDGYVEVGGAFEAFIDNFMVIAEDDDPVPGAIYYVFGGDTFIFGEDGYRPDQRGYVELGSGSHTETFTGSYPYYIVMIYEGNKAAIDTVRGSNGLYYGTVTTGNTLGSGNVGGPADSQCAVVGGLNLLDERGYILIDADGDDLSFVTVYTCE